MNLFTFNLHPEHCSPVFLPSPSATVCYKRGLAITVKDSLGFKLALTRFTAAVHTLDTHFGREEDAMFEDAFLPACDRNLQHRGLMTCKHVLSGHNSLHGSNKVYKTASMHGHQVQLWSPPMRLVLKQLVLLHKQDKAVLGISTYALCWSWESDTDVISRVRIIVTCYRLDGSAMLSIATVAVLCLLC